MHGADGANYSPFDVEQLVKDVMGEYDAYPSEKLEEMWEYKRWVTGVCTPVVACDGSNTYDRHFRWVGLCASNGVH